MNKLNGNPSVDSSALESKEIGISVVICCHNSARRLPPTLAHLAAQKIRRAAWEVILVDNASTDDTVEVARKCWPEELAHLYRIVREPQLGLTFARQRGLQEAAYEFVCFVDDDNWLCETWIEDVLDVMIGHPEVAICGGINEAVPETPAPAWFDFCRTMWAVSSPAQLTGDITSSGLSVCGAGLTLRQSAWRQLRSNGFTPILSGRRGASLIGNEDNELCFALRLAGWHLWVEPRLRLKHFLPAGRLTWKYARRLHRAAGFSGVPLDAYFYGALPKPTHIRPKLREFWQWQALTLMKRFALKPWRFLRFALSASEGESEALWVDMELGRLAGLARFGSEYSRSIAAVRSAAWRRAGKFSNGLNPPERVSAVDVPDTVAAGSDSKTS
jgi:cellulose synthase/poly-beta-1,6-N-acetylglucosamine synthase-like glycosyltransferase